MATRVFVDGQEGTTGLRINEYLAQRSDIEVLRVAPELRKDAAERARLLNAADVAFLCLPDAAAREAVALVTNPHDLPDRREHRAPHRQRLGVRPARAGARPARPHPRLASASPTRAATRPASSCWCGRSSTPAWCRRRRSLSATSITGYSGGGKKMIEQYEAGGDPRLDSPRPYGLALAHKHLPEMTTHSRLETRPLFMPIVGNFLKGLSVSVPLHLSR